MTNAQLAEHMASMHFTHSSEFSSLLPHSSNKGEDRVLVYLLKEKNHVLVGELTEALHLSTGRIANILKQLETKGMIKRVQQKDDRRRFEISLTAKGKKYTEKLFGEVDEFYQTLVKKLGKKDTEELLRLMTKTVTIMRQ